MAKFFKSFFSVFALVILAGATSFAQDVTGDIEGTVKDPSGASVPGVVVTVRSAQTSTGARPDAAAGFSRSITADSNGFYRMQQIPPGFYNLTTTALSGFGETVVNNIEVVTSRSTLVDINLPVAGSAPNVVDVLASDGTAIDPTSNKVLSNITSQAIDLLPKATNFTSLLQTVPSVRNEPLSGGFSVDGASASENTFVIDGQETSNFRTGTLNINNNIPFQFVQEIQVKSGGFEAEFGGATGGVVTVITKSGNNDFHGEVGTSFQIAQFQAGPRAFQASFNRPVAPGLPAFRGVEYIQPVKDEGTSSFPFATFSGPIIKNRAWFFGAYAPQRFNTNRTLDYINPDPRLRGTGPRATETYTQRIRREYAFGRIDIQPISSLRMTGSYTYNPLIQEGTLDAFGNTIGTVPAITFPGRGLVSGAQYLDGTGGRQNANNTNGSIIWTPTSKLVVTARGGYGFLNEKLGNYGNPSPNGLTRYLVQSTSTTAAPAGFGLAVNQQNFPAFAALQNDVSIRRTFDADASYLLTGLLGKHQFKGGFQYNGIYNNVLSNTVDQAIFRFGVSIAAVSGRSFLTSTPGAIGAGFLRRLATVGSARSNNKAFYIQDSWQPINRLTFNVGVRVEKEDSPSFAVGAPPINFGYGDKIAPRLGFALDLFGDGKTKIFGSYGKFFDRLKYELPRGSFGGDFFRDDFFEIFPGQTIASFTRQSIVGSFDDRIGGNCPLTVRTGLSRCQLDFRIPSNLPGNSLDLGQVDPDIKAFQQSEYTVGVERNLGAGYLFTGRYTHKQVDVAVEDIGFLTSEGGEAYVIGNPGFGQSAQVSRANNFLPLKAVRDYDAGEFRVTKRFATTAYLDASYTISRLFGNYAGLASSDEVARTAPNVNRNFDLPFIGYSALGQEDNGRLPTDRPHSFKLSGAYTYKWSNTNSTELSGFTIAQSGTPLTTRFVFYGVTGQILNGRGDLGRTAAFTQTDLGLRHKLRFGNDERFTMSFDLDVLNVLNEANELQRFDVLSANSINFGPEDVNIAPDGELQGIRIYQTQNTSTRINNFFNANQGLIDPRFNRPIAFQGPRSVRFGFRLLF